MAEIATLSGVTSAAVVNWRTPDPSFPKPVRELRSGPLYDERHIRRWLRNRKKADMTNVIAFINLKGGVGKTTTADAIGSMLAVVKRQRVLMIDLDPQTNLTTMLIGDKKWEQRNDAGQTLAQLFKDALAPEDTELIFDIEQAILRGVSPVDEVAQTRKLDPCRQAWT